MVLVVALVVTAIETEAPVDILFFETVAILHTTPYPKPPRLLNPKP